MSENGPVSGLPGKKKGLAAFSRMTCIEKAKGKMASGNRKPSLWSWEGLLSITIGKVRSFESGSGRRQPATLLQYRTLTRHNPPAGAAMPAFFRFFSSITRLKSSTVHFPNPTLTRHPTRFRTIRYRNPSPVMVKIYASPQVVQRASVMVLTGDVSSLP